MFAAGKTDGAVAVAANYIEEVFSTYLYTGNGSTQTITNNIDLSTKGGLVWIKDRTDTPFHVLTDTTRGVNSQLYTNSTADANSNTSGVTAFNSNGFNVGSWTFVNTASDNIVSWTFREQPKFFDVLTYTGNGSAGRTLSHSLASQPGFILIKRTDGADPWLAFARLNGTDYSSLRLNTTAAGSSYTQSDIASSTVINVGYINSNIYSCNISSETYVVYIFAHDAGGFGLTGTDNVISCGSYTGNGSGIGPIVTLGYEPQWIMVKPATVADNWTIVDNMRAMVAGGQSDSKLFPNSTGAETNTTAMSPEATGFQIKSISAEYNTNGATYIYIAIRRGPMKTPTTGTSVFQPVAYTGTNVDNRLVNTGIVTDMAMARIRTASSTGSFYTADRLRGNGFLGTAITDAENTDPDSFMTPTVGYGNSFSAMNGFGVGNDVTRQLNQSSTSQLAYAFQRAPSFFDEVCYTGTGSARTLTHNLGVAPELVIYKNRSGVAAWAVQSSSLPSVTGSILQLESTNAVATVANYYTTPTSTTIGFGSGAPTDGSINNSGATYVAYLFATCPGVSKVGSYTGTATTLQVDCGFTGGARFVLIKKTSGTGSWYVWDSSRGIVSGNDPYLLLNSTAAEVTNTDYIDTYSAGFEISSTAPSEINENGGSFIFLAIA